MFVSLILLANGNVSSAKAGEVLDRIAARGVIVVATDPVWPPYSWKDETGEWHGFDVEVAQEIARRMGVSLEFVTPSWDEQTAGHWNGKWDISVGSMTPTAKRDESLDFPMYYSYGMTSLAVHEDNTSIQIPSDASDKRIGVLAASIYEKYLTREPHDIVGMPPVTYKIDDPIIVRFDQEDLVALALAKGDGAELDAMVGTLANILHLIEEGMPLKVIGQPLVYLPSAAAIEPGNAEFSALLSQINEDMHVDGTLSALSEKWFGLDLTKGP
jgi:polar amino acid transport system substrate-binding protein